MAPSVHNTQPWRLRLKDGRLDLFADRSRQLAVLDPTGRQMLVSCGCALMNARVSLAGDGLGAAVIRTRRPLVDEPLASLDVIAEPADLELAQLDPVVEVRQTNRRHFSDEPVPQALLDVLETAAAAESAWLYIVRHPDQQTTVATLSRRADDVENLNPAYRAELRAWSTDDPLRADGGGLPGRTASSSNQCLVLLGTAGDSPVEWLRAGEALERVLLEVTRYGFAASPLTQVTEVPSTRAQLRRELRMDGYPHVLLRIGRAPTSPTSRRRRLVEVLTEEG
jgi:nitroreductase